MADAGITSSARRRIVIIGAGYGGAYCAQTLERTLRGVDAEVILLDRNNYFVFFPLLVEAGTGSLEPRHAVVPIRAFLKRVEFRMANVTAVDVSRRSVEYQLVGADDVQTIAYDHLVIALGSVTRLPSPEAVPGVREHAFEMKSLADAVALRDRAINMLELANATDDAALRREMLHLVVVGGNFTGAEVAGEFDAFLNRARSVYTRVQKGECHVTLLELADRILAPLGPELSEFAASHMRRRGIDVRLRTTATRIEERRVVLSTGEVLPARTVIWCAGIEPSPLARRLGLPLDQRGYILCERNLRVRGFDNVWAIGDCAVNIDKDNKPYPATAQHAVKQGKHLAKNLAAVLRGGATTPCGIVSQGSLAALGCRTGVAKVFGISISGFWAWWLWRTVYLLKMPKLSRKLRVALDWTLDLFFSRDIVGLGLHRPPGRE